MVVMYEALEDMFGLLGLVTVVLIYIILVARHARLEDRQESKKKTENIVTRYNFNNNKRNALQPLPRKPDAITSKPYYDGHVYLIREEFGTYKIGRTKNVPNRYNTLKIQIPQKTKLVWSIKCHDHKRAERSLHSRYKTSRRKGEWFTLTPTQVHEITRLTDGDLG